VIDRERQPGWSQPLRAAGVPAALGAAFLFGASTPLSKALLSSVDPWLLAGLLYLGSGLGLAAYRLVRPTSRRARLAHGEWPWLISAIVAGGIIAPVLLMYGLTHLAASSASLLLNTEGAFTALLAWFVFRENFDLRIAVGMIAIVAGAAIISWPGEPASLPMAVGPTLAVLGACLAWGLDNNLTRKVSLADPTWIACIKGLVAGTTNLLLALVLTRSLTLPPMVSVGAALVVGCIAYGVSLSLFVLSLRYLGSARTAAYFSVAPFFGAALSILLLKEAVTVQLMTAGALMAFGVWLHLTEHHSHEHTHDALEHEHEHVHDEHHRHEHDATQVAGATGKHTHAHRHDSLTHGHAHYPDAHHRHDH